ncbi:MAG: hypothetical protein HRT61_03650 [Ekhidna sp.]|nr:hypothetical protein [Ekhidna sp.]
MNLNKGNIFLVDGIGAATTALLLGLLLRNFEEFFGMPGDIVLVLCAVATVFACYSFFCHFKGVKLKPYLIIIAIANSMYCLATLVLVILNQGRLSVFGLAYFLGEIIIVICLVFFELKISKVNK